MWFELPTRIQPRRPVEPTKLYQTLGALSSNLRGVEGVINNTPRRAGNVDGRGGRAEMSRGGWGIVPFLAPCLRYLTTRTGFQSFSGSLSEVNQKPTTLMSQKGLPNIHKSPTVCAIVEPSALEKQCVGYRASRAG